MRPPEHVLADRDACDEIAATVLDPNVLLLGDPPLGRSALDERRRTDFSEDPGRMGKSLR